MFAKPFGLQELLDFGEECRVHSVGNIHAFACDAIHAITFAPGKVAHGSQKGMENGWRERLKEAIADTGKSLRSLSQATGFGENYVQQMLKDEKDPSFPRLAKLLSILGAPATLYVISGTKSDTESQLRSALLAYGVDRDDLKSVMKAIKGFRDDDENDDEPPQSARPDDQSEPASRPHGSKPSRKQPQRSGA